MSTKRIKDFLELPESNNVREYNCKGQQTTTKENLNQDTVIDKDDDDDNYLNKDDFDGAECVDQFSDDEISNKPTGRSEYVVTFKNAAFTWGKRSDMLLEVDDLEIPAGESCLHTIFKWLTVFL